MSAKGTIQALRDGDPEIQGFASALSDRELRDVIRKAEQQIDDTRVLLAHYRKLLSERVV